MPVRDLIRIVASEAGVRMENIKIIFKGHDLNSKDTLGQYELIDGDLLQAKIIF